MTSISDLTLGSDGIIWAGYSSLEENLRRYLENNGWVEQSPGRVGALWHAPNLPGLDNAIIVPSRVVPGSFEWRSVVTRLADFERKPLDDIVLRIATHYIDVSKFRAAGEDVVQGSIPLETAAKVVTSARSMLRSVGTTSRRPRTAIDGNFSTFGDNIVSRARMAHTEDGSFVFPVLMPIPEPAQDHNDQAALTGMEVEWMLPESSERRVMRTLAQSLDAANAVIVHPDRAPRRTADLIPFIAAGGSKELLASLHSILEQPSVETFEATFSWAGGVNAPGGVANSVVVTSEAAPRIEQAVQLLTPSEHFPSQIYTGQIAAIIRPRQEIELDTVHNGRKCRLFVRLERDIFNQTYDWARDERTVFVEGDVTRSARRFFVEHPRTIGPLEEMFLRSGGDWST